MNEQRIREIFIENGFTIKDGQSDLKRYVYDAARAIIAETRKIDARIVPEGWALVPDAENADEIVSRLYRRFKDWSNRGFGPDDVTWCEVKADVIAMIADSSPDPAPLRARIAELESEGEQLRMSWHNSRILIAELIKVRNAAENLIAMKGRHNTELAYQRLVDVVGATGNEQP